MSFSYMFKTFNDKKYSKKFYPLVKKVFENQETGPLLDYLLQCVPENSFESEELKKDGAKSDIGMLLYTVFQICSDSLDLLNGHFEKELIYNSMQKLAGENSGVINSIIGEILEIEVDRDLTDEEIKTLDTLKYISEEYPEYENLDQNIVPHVAEDGFFCGLLTFDQSKKLMSLISKIELEDEKAIDSLEILRKLLESSTERGLGITCYIA